MKLRESFVHSQCTPVEDLRSGIFERRSWEIAFPQGVVLSERLDVLSLQALRTLGYVELNRLALLKAFEASRLDCRKMHKNVFATLTADEAVAFGVIEPLYCSLFCHVDTVFLSIGLRWRDSEVQKAGTGC
jgi:hypothetical protein